jgi:hypothetical protein
MVTIAATNKCTAPFTMATIANSGVPRLALGELIPPVVSLIAELQSMFSMAALPISTL